MRVHGRCCARSENPIVNASAGILSGDGRGDIGRRTCWTLRRLDVENFVRSGAGVVNPVRVARLRQRKRGNIAWLGLRWRGFRFIDFLLCDGGGRKVDRDTVMSMRVKACGLPGSEEHVNYGYEVVLKDHLMKRFVFNRDRSDIGRLLRRQNAGDGEQYDG